MAARIIQTVAKGLARASAARGGAPPLCTLGILSTPTGRLAQAPCFKPMVHLPLSVRRMSSWDWDKSIPQWMYGSIHDPQIVFHRLKLENKEVLQLVQLMVTESVTQVKAHNGEGVELLMVELFKIKSAQRDQQGLIKALAICVVSGAGYVYSEYHEMKSKIIELATNLAAHSPEILSDVIAAGKYEGPWLLGKLVGKGKPWEWRWEWLEPKEAKDVKQGGGDGPVKK